MPWRTAHPLCVWRLHFHISLGMTWQEASHSYAHRLEERGHKGISQNQRQEIELGHSLHSQSLTAARWPLWASLCTPALWTPLMPTQSSNSLLASVPVWLWLPGVLTLASALHDLKNPRLNYLDSISGLLHYNRKSESNRLIWAIGVRQLLPVPSAKEE